MGLNSRQYSTGYVTDDTKLAYYQCAAHVQLGFGVQSREFQLRAGFMKLLFFVFSVQQNLRQFTPVILYRLNRCNGDDQRVIGNVMFILLQSILKGLDLGAGVDLKSFLSPAELQLWSDISIDAGKAGGYGNAAPTLFHAELQKGTGIQEESTTMSHWTTPATGFQVDSPSMIRQLIGETELETYAYGGTKMPPISLGLSGVRMLSSAPTTSCPGTPQPLGSMQEAHMR